MKSLKFLAIGSFIAAMLLTPLSGNACIQMDDEGYASTPFRIMEEKAYEEAKENSGNAETVNFWLLYTKGNVSEKDIIFFFDNASKENMLSDNFALITYLNTKKDKTAISYLNDCLEFTEELNDYNGNLWDYEKPDTNGFKKILERVKKSSHTGVLKDRYLFLMIRLYGALRDNAAIMQLWQTRGKKMADSVLKNRIEGYVAGAMYRQGNYVEAMDLFDKLGDDVSVSWCMDKLAGAKNLEKLYNHNPNSTAVNYILEDYINYLIASTNAGRQKQSTGAEDYSYSFYSPEIREILNRCVYDTYAESTDMAALCKRVLSENVTKTPKPWAMALGVIQGIHGNVSEACLTFEKAATMDGNKAMERTLKQFTLWARMLKSAKGNDAADREFIVALEEFYNIASREAKEYVNDYTPRSNDEYYYVNPRTFRNVEFFSNFFAREAEAYYGGLNKPNYALTILAMADSMPQIYFDNRNLTRLRDKLDKELDFKYVTDFLMYASGAKKDNALDKYMQPFAANYVDLTNDVIGTRLMREGKFKEALPFLSQVDPRWIRSQPISEYLHNTIFDYGEYNFGSRTRAHWSPYLSNHKAQFCSNMIVAQREYEKLSGDEQSKKAIEIAAMLHFGSPLGSGWALSEYSWSSLYKENEFTKQMHQWLLLALNVKTAPVSTKCVAYYALLKMPGEKKDDWVTFPVGSTYVNGKDAYFLDSPTALQRIGLNYIASNWDAVSDNYMFSRCDVLRSYINHKFVEKPKYLSYATE